MENIVIADCMEEELSPSFMKGLNAGSDKRYELRAHIANWGRDGYMSGLRRYLKYFSVPLRYFISRRRYGDIIGWQQFYALVFCFYCSIFRVEKINQVTALNFTYKEKRGWPGRLYRWFMSRCLSGGYLDHIHVLSHDYADIIAKGFDFPRDRIIVTAFGVDDGYGRYGGLDTPDGYEREGYILSIGRSNRDYDFLIRAWRGIGHRLVIVSDTYAGKTDDPDICIRRDISSEEQYPWIANCKAVIIPIDDGAVCSGDTVLLTAMSLKRILIVTKPSTLAEMYIEDREDGLLIEKDIEGFKHLIHDVMDGVYDDLGEKARQHFLECFSRERMAFGIAKEMGRIR